MPNASLNIGGDASGAIAAAAAAQGAVDGLHGKTLIVDIETRGGAAVAGMASDMGKMANAAGRANRAAKSMGDHFERAGRATGGMGGGFERAGAGAERAGRAARSMGEDFGRAGEQVASMAGHAERVQRAVGAIGSAPGMRAIGSDASSAGRGMRELESSSSRAGVAVRNVMPSGGGGLGAGRAQIRGTYMDMEQLADGTFGVAGAMKSAGAASEKMSSQARAGMRALGSGGAGPKAIGAGAAKPFSWAGVGSDDFGYTGPQPGSRKPRGSSGSGEERPFSAGGAAEQLAARKVAAGVDEVGKSASRAGGSVRSMNSALGGHGISGGLHSVERMIRPFQEVGFQAAMVGGMLAGVTKEAGKLMDSTTGMGLNFAGMSAGIERAEQSAARSHNLGLNGLDQSLRQTARGMTNELAPAMTAGVQATKAFEQAKMGAQGSLGPSIEGFANQVTQSAPALQGIMSSLGRTALGLGTDVVAGVSQAGPAFAGLAQTVADNAGGITAGVKSFATGVADVANGAVHLGKGMSDAYSGPTDAGSAAGDWTNKAAQWIGDQGRSMLNGKSFSPLSAMPTGHDMMGRPTSAAPAAAAAKPGAFDPNRPFSGTAIGSDGSLNTGTGDGGVAKPGSAGGGAYRPSRDAAWATGKTGAQVLTAERGAIGLGPVGAQEYSGHGAPPAGVGQPLPGAAPPVWQRGGAQPPRVGGPGSSGGGAQMPSAIAGGLGMAQPMQSGAAQGAQTGADLGGAMVQHVQKAVHVASAAASAGGQAIGGAMVGGAAQGITTNQTVTDTAIIRHLKKVQDMAAGPSGIDAHSPSRKYDDLGRLIPQGLAQGVDNDAHHAFGAVQSMVGQAQSFGSQSPGLGQYAYANGGAPTTVSVGRNQAATPNQDPNQAPLNPMQSTSSTSMAPPVNQFGAAGMANIQAHNDYAAKLAQGRMDNHAIAEANLGNINPATGQKWQDPRRADSNAFAGQDAAQAPHPGSHGPAPRVGGPGSTGGGAAMPSSISSGLGLGKTQGPWAGLNADLHSGMVKAGQNSTQGLLAGVKVGLPAVASAGGAVAGAGQAGYKKADKQASPSAVWAGMGGNSVAGVPVGFAAGVPAAVSAIGDATAQMSAAIAGPLNNQGLMLGYSYATNVVTGATTALKTANFQASGTPQIANQQAAAAVGQIGLLGMGAGSSVYKTPSVSENGAGTPAQMAAALQAAVQSMPLSVTVNLDGQYVDQKIASGQGGLVEILRDALTGANG